MNVAKKILIEELNENTHPERVEDVIFWALKEYSEKHQKTWGRVIAYTIIDKIEEKESLSK